MPDFDSGHPLIYRRCFFKPVRSLVNTDPARDLFADWTTTLEPAFSVLPSVDRTDNNSIDSAGKNFFAGFSRQNEVWQSVVEVNR